jgi:hypothetical protein
MLCYTIETNENMRSAFIIIILLLAIHSKAASQSGSSAWTFFPDHLGFMPPLANHEEARVGILQEVGSPRMVVAIGNALDVVQFAGGTDTLRFGVDFFAFALASDYSGYRLKIGAADGFFGIHFTVNSPSPFRFRFRALHFSAHLVDGMYDQVSNEWKDGLAPFPFSRNYGEILASADLLSGSFTGRAYAGASYAVVMKPSAIRRTSALAGAEMSTSRSPYLYAAYNGTLLGVPAYIWSNTVELGVKFGTWSRQGLRVHITYQNGLDWFGEFYSERKEFVGVGFAFDFW